MEGELLPLKRDSSEVVRLSREQPPAHCLLKVESFSLLRDSLMKPTKDYFQSTDFKAGGFKWVLHVYPNGNKNENGDGHLSLYVAMVDDISDRYVNASLRFFVYDQLRDNYLTVIDIREKRFTSLKSTWGVPKFLPEASFTDASNGFLVNDYCIFGAEVLVIDGQIQTSALSIMKAICNWSYTWRIESFSKLSYPKLCSPVFKFNNVSWRLTLYPKGVQQEEEKSLSLFLELDSVPIPGSKLFVIFCLWLKNHRKGDDPQTCNQWFYSKGYCWGYPSFLPLSVLHNKSKGFLKKDVVIVELRIEKMFLVKEIKPAGKP